MRHFAIPILIGLLTPAFWPGLAWTAGPGQISPIPADACAAHIARAERDHRMPPGLLTAISLAESGRAQRREGARIAWPWTVMAEGRGRYYPSKAAAITAVERLQKRGVRNIDVGCMQVNLMHHPDAFPSLAKAFEPASNVAYAAAFFAGHYRTAKSWSRAVGRYHSATPTLANAYTTRVYRIWHRVRRDAARQEIAAADAARKERAREDGKDGAGRVAVWNAEIVASRVRFADLMRARIEAQSKN